ncbi:MAG: M20/M25/M40 family metallo-hydrolase [Candidatus Kapabacteria bacterium]|jgi:acetylornithine deacetylase/succinyl-diaminopimelate desuccinylase-like protein|nr:M20/M25/M40 family metallo-hydrolase [Candidatus Kapabacteria bacterium]
MQNFFFLFLFLAFGQSQAQTQLPPIKPLQNLTSVRSYREANEHAMLREFRNFLALPNVVGDSLNIVQNADFVVEMMKKRGIENVQLLRGTKPDAPPAVFGEVKTKGATKTIILYAHYDGQPVNPLEWSRDGKPFAPVLRSGALDKGGEIIRFPDEKSAMRINPEYRIYARSASDDKGGVVAILNAYEALRKSGIQPSVNLKFFFEGEEEAGSPNLGDILERNKAVLQSDGWIICDGPVHQSGRKQVVCGVRGDVNMEITVFGPKRPLHSGHYGNWVPNPAQKLVLLLASMKDSSGRVLVEGFYDDVVPFTDEESAAIRAIPHPDEQMKRELGVAKPDGAGALLLEMLNLPSLNLNGIRAANVGAMAANVIPTQAVAALDLRLVLGNDWQRQSEKIKRHIQKQGYYVIDREPSDEERLQHANIAKVRTFPGYNAQRTPLSHPLAKAVIAAVQTTISEPLVVVPSLGGSLPLYLFEKHLKSTTVTVPIANHDNNQHAENENLRLQNLWNGLETFAAIMMMRY